MHYVALATDYDGTVAHDGVVEESALAALERLRTANRRLILVTGRELPDLQRVMPRLDLFDLVVAENGALLYRPAVSEERPLAEPPPQRFVERLRELGVDPLSVGRVIVASWEPNEGRVLQAAADHLQQRRGDGAAARYQQGKRLARERRACRPFRRVA
jgi:HAD superfamily hydrolase (TIGR01484 family)